MPKRMRVLPPIGKEQTVSKIWVGEHDCEKYRFTADKYDPDGKGSLDLNKPVLVSWCSLCGKFLRVVKRNDKK